MARSIWIEKGIFRREDRPGYAARWKGPDGRILYKWFPKLSLARDFYHKKKSEDAELRFFPERKEALRPVPFGELVDLYENYAKRELKSSRTLGYMLKFLKKMFADKTAAEVSLRDVEKLKDQLFKQGAAKRKKVGGGVSKTTVNYFVRVLKRVFNFAVEQKVISFNPIRDAKPPRPNPGRMRYLRDEENEEAELIAEVVPWLKDIVVFALNTGARMGEILSIKKCDVDFANGQIRIPPGKNGEARWVPMNSTIRELVQKMPARLRSDFLFKRYSGSFVTHSFTKASRAAGLEDFHFHDLRHTFASRLVMAGVDLRTVQELLGHKDVRMVARYAHLSPEHKKKAVETLVNRAVVPGKSTENATENKSA